jgi:(S)-sulfolactate dehydrogenase
MFLSMSHWMSSKGARFDGIDALILTPHIAGVTHESNRRVSQVTAENVLRALGYE